MLAGLLERTIDRLINPAIVHHKMRRPTRCWCSGPVRTFPQRLLVGLLASWLRRAAGLGPKALGIIEAALKEHVFNLT